MITTREVAAADLEVVEVDLEVVETTIHGVVGHPEVLEAMREINPEEESLVETMEDKEGITEVIIGSHITELNSYTKLISNSKTERKV